MWLWTRKLKDSDEDKLVRNQGWSKRTFLSSVKKTYDEDIHFRVKEMMDGCSGSTYLNVKTLLNCAFEHKLQEAKFSS